MLHLKFALNLEHLADEMIDEITEHWKDPFKAPVVIFPDSKLEQWFRLRWVKKNGVLANLNKSTIDRFLFDILVGDDESKSKLTAEMLTNVILAYLRKENDGVPNYKTLDDEVTRYLMVDRVDEKGNLQKVLDENRLFDFANKMASLFLDYETSRPKGFARNSKGEAPGILEKWKMGDLKPFFAESNKDVAGREKWQQKLYSAVFHGENSLLNEMFKNENIRKGLDQENRGVTYLTIPYLYSQVIEREKKGEKPFYDEKLNDAPLFIFGLSGMGQFYRVILQKFAEKHEVYAYVQNPCMEFWEDVKSVRETHKVRRNWKSKENVWSSAEGENLADIQAKMKVSFDEDSSAEVDVDDIPESIANNEENDLLISWGRSGRDNIKLWCQASNYDFDFKGVDGYEADANDLPQDSLLHKVQYSIAHRETLKGVTEADLKDGSLEVTAAPTRIREIEDLHTKICKLLKNGIRVEDILVVSPCLDDYRTAISMVFDQTPVKSDEKDNEGFLHVRFSIVDSPAKASLTESALESLFSILQHKSITRPDFFSLVRNPVVQAARSLKNEEIDAWQEWVAETNTYRIRDQKDDWLKSVNRLLLAQMSTSDALLYGDETRPYSNMDSSNKASLCRFVECIESLQKWIELGVDRENDELKALPELTLLQERLNEWLGMQTVPDTLQSEMIVYKKVLKALDELHCQLSAGAPSISMNIVQQSLLLAAQGTEYSCGNLFVNGITFMKFVPNRAVPVKYLFFVGANASTFPGAKQHNTLDLRKSCRPWPGDDSPIAKNRYAFLCQFMSTSERFYLSYLSKDVKKDAELYPSSVVSDLRKFIESATKNEADGKTLKWEDLSVSLDETRKFEDLFTQKSLRNKIAYIKMLKDDSDGEVDDEDDDVTAPTEKEPTKSLTFESVFVKRDELQKMVKLPDRVSFYSLSSFLTDPFQFRVSQMLMEEDDEDVEKESFEPVFFDHLDTSAVLKKMVVATLSEDDSAEKKELEKLQRELELCGKMPGGVFGEKQESLLKAKAFLILDQMAESYENTPALVRKELAGCDDKSALCANDGKFYKFQFIDGWSFGAKIQDMVMSRSGDSHWLLSGRLDWCNAPQGEVEKTTKIIGITTSDSKNSSISLDKYLSSYVKALTLIAYKGEKNPTVADVEQTIEILIYSCDSQKSGPAVTKVSFTPNDAKKKLEEIYATAFGEIKNKVVLPFCKAVPAEMLDWPSKDSDEKSIFGFRKKLVDDHGPWAYFDKKSLFDPVVDVGFSAENFESEWSDAKNVMRDLIKIEKYAKPKSSKASSKTKKSDADNTETKKKTRKVKAEK